jgi:hypothetical protein
MVLPRDPPDAPLKNCLTITPFPHSSSRSPSKFEYNYNRLKNHSLSYMFRLCEALFKEYFMLILTVLHKDEPGEEKHNAEWNKLVCPR